MSFKSALQRDLDRLFKTLNNSEFNIREVTKGALTQARAKLNPWAFKRLNEVAVDSFYRDADYQVWSGHRLLAVDGTRLLLPKHKTISAQFGEYKLGPNADSLQCMAIGSTLYDVLNGVTIDADMAPYTGSERDLLVNHLEKVEKGDLLLLDRGYPCFWLLFLLKAKGIEFCVRLKDNWWRSVHNFVKSNEQERIVSFVLPKKDRDKLADYPELQDTEQKFKLVKVVLEDGSIEVLCTSLMDSKAHCVDDFKELYHYRWNQEEAYKLLKSRADLEAFSGKTARAVEQDFYSKVFLLTMTAIFAYPIEKKVRQEYKADQNRLYDQKINRTNALSNTMELMIPIFLKRKCQEALNAFDEIIYKTREIIRPQRNVHRKHRPKKQHYMNYKKL